MYSMARFCPSTYPNSRSPCSIGAQSPPLRGLLTPTEPTRNILGIGCPRAASGHAAAAPPMSVMNWRHLRSSMGSSPEPAVPAYRRLRMLRKRPQVLGIDINRQKIGATFPLPARSTHGSPASRRTPYLRGGPNKENRRPPVWRCGGPYDSPPAKIGTAPNFFAPPIFSPPHPPHRHTFVS